MKSVVSNIKNGLSLKKTHDAKSTIRKSSGLLGIFVTLFISLSMILSLPTSSAVTQNTNFTVNVIDSLSVSVTTPVSGATGDINQFLRNQVDLSVTTNNANGFTASMTAKTTSTSLVNNAQSSNLPTLASNNVVRSSFPANYWGYSLDDVVASGGVDTSHYSAMVPSNTASPITLLSSNVAATMDKTFFFGAKANSSLPSGTYKGTVVISVVTDTIGPDNPVIPDNPAKPEDDTTGGTGTYDSTNNRTVYSTTSTDAVAGTTTTETRVDTGNTIYTGPMGATENINSHIVTNSALATGLGIAASVAAASGGFFFLVATRDEGDEEEEDEDEEEKLS
ncbi:hypothetical protein IJG71_01095 [Candidatus Saccharibacteria bacterium]|nr:hypothetical protein [Candidatus Saccharibacteria bacterium]